MREMPEARSRMRAKIWAREQYNELLIGLNELDLYNEEQIVQIIEHAYLEGVSDSIADLVPKWISVGEGMPNEGEIIELAVIGQHSKEVIQGIYEFRTWYGADNQPLGDDFTVTHWRERPEYPDSD